MYDVNYYDYISINEEFNYKDNVFGIYLQRYGLKNKNLVSTHIKEINNPVLELIEEYENSSVYDTSIDSTIPKNLIEKIVIGGLISGLRSFKDKLQNLKEIFIKDNYLGDITCLKSILSYCSVNVNLTIDANNEKYCYESPFLMSKDKKILYIVTNVNKEINIPSTIEIVKSGAFIKNIKAKIAKNTVSIYWPKNLKTIEDRVLPMSYNGKIEGDPFSNGVPQFIEYADCCYIDNSKGAKRKGPIILNNQCLEVNSSIKCLSEELLSLSDLQINAIKGANNYKMSKELLLSADGTILYRAFINKSIKKVVIPDTVKEIKKYAFWGCYNLKTIVLYEKSQFLMKFLDLNKYKVEIIKNPVEEINNIPEYNNEINLVPYKPRSKSMKLGNYVNSEKVTISKDLFNEKTSFVLTKECSKIKHLIIEEGITEFLIDEECYYMEFNLEIIQIPSTVKAVTLFTKLEPLKNLMLVVMNPDKKITYKVHKLHYILACLNEINMPNHTADSRAWIDGGHLMDFNPTINEITYIKSFKFENLYYDDKAYYYLKSKGYELLKVKNVEEYQIPSTANNKKVVSIANFAFANYNGPTVVINNKISLKKYAVYNYDNYEIEL